MSNASTAPMATPTLPTPLPIRLDQVSQEWLKARLLEIEKTAEKDVIVIMGVITPELDVVVRMALEHLEERRESLLVILDTPGGSVEVAARISDTLRHFHKAVDFLIPNEAMSAGTILALSGDAIRMDYFSRLGPIDPQVQRDGRWVPGLSYLRQYEALIVKSKEEGLTEAELVLLSKLDLAELDQIKLAAALSVSLIKQWLPRHKFKDWKKHKDGRPVTKGDKENRAEEIAGALSDQKRWGTHGRGINMATLRELKLKIDDFGETPELRKLVWRHFWTAREFAQKQQFHFFVHSRSF